MTPLSSLRIERIDDIPLLLAQLERMGVRELLDWHFPPHGNWMGLSPGWTTVLWYAFGYSLCFSGDAGGIIGNLDMAFLRGVDLSTPSPINDTVIFVAPPDREARLESRTTITSTLKRDTSVASLAPWKVNFFRSGDRTSDTR